MKNFILSCLGALTFMALFSCGTSSKATKTRTADMHNSQNSLDWFGVYSGIVPCADCKGIETTIQLENNENYRIQTQYLGVEKMNSPTDSGTFKWNKEGNTILLDNGNQYFVGENMLTQLDRKGNKITGSLAQKYILKKRSATLKETYWKLISLKGKSIKVDSTFNREPHIILKEKDNRIFGNAGCNQISGTYKLEDGHKISFSRIISTMMACPNLKLEDEFKKVLERTDHYSQMGTELILLNGTTPLARFKAVYLE